MTYHFLVKSRFHSWIALTFIISVHILHLSPHSSRTQYLVEQSYFLLLGGNCFEQPIGEYILGPHQQPINVVWGRPIFPSLPMSLLKLPHLNHNHYVFIRHLVHWDQIQLGYSYHRSFCQIQIQWCAIMAHHYLTTSAPACTSHLPCEFQRRCPPKWCAPHLFHIMWNLYKFQYLTL
jgi:hypothetical protein